MPRTGPGKKPANPHNNRHENGLVGPGKRIVKQKSNGHLNGSPKGRSQSITPPLPTPSTEQPLTLGEENNVNGSVAEAKHDLNGIPHVGEMRARATSLSFENAEILSSACENGSVFQASPEGHPHRQSDANPTKTDTPYTANPVRLASSILYACPVHDTIALLILLLHFPPALVTIIQYGFAMLSFLPQSMNPVIYLLDISKDSPGAPAMSTVLFTSAPAILVMLMTWTSLQNFLLDIAQVQIAIMFGGGYSDKSRSFNSAVVCIFVVSVMHLLQSKGVRQLVSDNALSSWILNYARPHIPPTLLPLLERLNTPTGRNFRQAPPTWIRVVPAGHILASAGLHIIRRWLFKKNKNQTSKSTKSRDTEASAGSNPQDLSDTPLVGPSYPADGSSVSSPHKILESRERHHITKKRKRQQTLVQSQQPFWALLGRTKVNLVRHNEHSRTLSSTSTLSGRENKIGEADLASGGQTGVWISHIDSTTVVFEVRYPFAEEENGVSNGSYRHPFYVRINGANWASTSIYPKDISSKPGGNGRVVWIGEVSGLAPNGVYNCSMVCYHDEKEFCVLNLKTPAAPDTEQLSSTHRETLRPDSPTTTMKNSIAAAEVKLNEAKSRVKRGKRDHKNAQANIKRETESLASRLTSSGGGDEKFKQKSLQLSQDIRRAEETCVEVDAILEELESVPEDELEEWSNKKSTHNTEKRSLLSSRDEFNIGRQACQSNLASVQQELAHVQKQLEKVKKYQGKLKEQYDSISQAKELGLSEKDRKTNEQAAKENSRKLIEQTFNDQHGAYAAAIQSETVRTQSAWSHIRHIDQQQQAAAVAQAAHAAKAQQQQQLLNLQQSSGPLTPEGNLPGTNPTNVRSAFMFPFPSLGGLSALDSPLPSHATPHSSLPQPSPRLPFTSLAASARARERSNSIRSGHSAYTDFSDADPMPPMPGAGSDSAFIGPPRTGSSGNNSSSGGAQPSPISRGKGSPAMWVG